MTALGSAPLAAARRKACSAPSYPSGSWFSLPDSGKPSLIRRTVSPRVSSSSYFPVGEVDRAGRLPSTPVQWMSASKPRFLTAVARM